MTMVPLGGIVSSAAGAPLSQTAGSEAERVQQENIAHARQTEANQQAELAAGIGQTGEDQESSERDADGRRLWEGPTKARKGTTKPSAADTQPRQSKDATGQSGNHLD